jgi:hypothetical protein
VQDAVFLVERCDDHIAAEFHEFLLGCGCPLNIIAQSGY